MRQFSCACLLLMTGAGLVALVAGCEGNSHAANKAKQPAAEGPRVVTVTVAPIEVRPVQRKISAVGTLCGLEKFEISAKVGGRIEQIACDVGDRVKPGDILAQIDPTDYRLAVEEAQRNLERELAKLDLRQIPDETFDPERLPSVVRSRLLVKNAQRKYDRARGLLEKQASSLQEFEQTETELRVEEAALRQVMLDIRSNLAAVRHAQAVLEKAKQQLVDTQVVAPPFMHTAGQLPATATYVISRRLVTAGEIAGPSTPMFELVLDDTLKLKAIVPERFASRVKDDQPVELSVEAYPGDVFHATVARISPIVNPESRTFEVEAYVPNSDHRLQDGGFAKAAILTQDAAEAVTAPLESLVTFAGVTKVFCVIDGKAQGIPVSVGTRGDGWVELVGAIEPGATVVTSGQRQLADGVAVTVRQPLKAENTASR